ncbi:MAG: hypothetical protein LC730_03860, partial [Acidobacteria bacterium]|nr:hypothetical protein [Acidobacteriota bacterium]MCA1608582.1 hypothetical protein [Acidobacteriota bacterium]
MAQRLTSPDEIKQSIDLSLEWLLVRESGRAFSLRRTEIDVSVDRGKTLFDFVDETGCRTMRLFSAELEDGQICLEVGSIFGREIEQMRLVSRTPAAEFRLNVELARL